MVKIENKVALVTGASRGIGQQIARSLAAAGAQVIGTATSQQGADKITADLSEFGGVGQVLDVSSDNSVDAMFAAIKDGPGLPDILVNNAGITNDKLLMRMKSDDWDQVINTNLSSVYRMSKACLRSMMKARFGRIINIGSVIGSMGNAGQTSYAAAKAGMIGFSKSLAREVGSRGITVNMIAPGYIATDMTDELDEKQKEHMLAQIPLMSMGQAEDVANAVLFLASDMGAYITGETIHVNGGMHMA